LSGPDNMVTQRHTRFRDRREDCKLWKEVSGTLSEKKKRGISTDVKSGQATQGDLKGYGRAGQVYSHNTKSRSSNGRTH